LQPHYKPREYGAIFHEDICSLILNPETFFSQRKRKGRNARKASQNDTSIFEQEKRKKKPHFALNHHRLGFN